MQNRLTLKNKKMDSLLLGFALLLYFLSPNYIINTSHTRIYNYCYLCCLHAFVYVLRRMGDVVFRWNLVKATPTREQFLNLDPFEVSLFDI